MLYLAWRNVARRLGQSAVTAIIIAVVTCVVAASAVVVVSLEHSVSLSRERLGADVMVLPVGASSSASEVLFTAQPVNVYLPDATGAAVAGAGGVAQATPQFFTQTVNESCCSVVGITRIVGIDAATDFVLKPWVRGGGAIDLGPDGILVGAKAPAIEGDQVSILGSVFHVAGTLEETGTSMDETIFMDLQSARSIASGSPYLAGLWEDKDPFSCVSCIMVKTETGADAAQVAEAIMASCPGTVAVVASEVVAGASSQLSAVEALCAALAGSLGRRGGIGPDGPVLRAGLLPHGGVGAHAHAGGGHAGRAGERAVRGGARGPDRCPGRRRGRGFGRHGCARDRARRPCLAGGGAVLRRHRGLRPGGRGVRPGSEHACRGVPGRQGGALRPQETLAKGGL